MKDKQASHRDFPPTRWTLVANSKEDSDEVRNRAVSELCESYWPPIYAFFRSRGNSSEESEDLTQGFFSDFLQRNHFAAAQEERGRLRTYLLKSVTNYANRIHRDSARQKRGGGDAPLSLDMLDENGYPVITVESETLSPDSAFQRQWAITLLRQVLETLREEYRKKGKEAHFEELEFAVSTAAISRSHSEIAEKLGCSVSNVKVMAYRLREGYQRTLRETIADTLLPGESVEEEIKELMSSFD